MTNIGLLFKPELIDIEPIKYLLLGLKDKYNINFFILDKNEAFCPPELLCHFPMQLTDINMIICFGGDGTILRSVKHSVKNNAPVLGINYGKLGFLSEYSLKEFQIAITDFISKRFLLESRMLLNVSLYRNNKVILEELALNDAVLYKGSDAKLVDLKLYSNKNLVYEMRSDGLIISSPTGSTAYSLSAGGAILSPNMEAIIVTPLNPHNLTIRPMVFSASDFVSTVLSSDSQVFLQIDGVNVCKLESGDKIVIDKYYKSIDFIKLNNKSFYKILRHKLHLGKQ
ncbi:MAG: NAD(+)/NADH kinase [Candidatus Cloacimonetes bacterium]|jgi:NAD+ kinase|nr:NAD(+)/NADH kinase [Candidatus Cloacimonadota bacterium]MDD4155185.1 NAD(+)/NADH kinase [Candidatus Cloacimonadota bacterium]